MGFEDGKTFLAMIFPSIFSTHRNTRSYIMNRSIKVIVVGLAMAAASHTATAAPKKAAVESRTVYFADLNLQSEAGAATLLNRISKAARIVCDIPPPGASNIHPKNGRHQCRRDAIQNAVASLDHPVVTAVYENSRAITRMKLASR
jgi:UrcA family protein